MRWLHMLLIDAQDMESADVFKKKKRFIHTWVVRGYPHIMSVLFFVVCGVVKHSQLIYIYIYLYE